MQITMNPIGYISSPYKQKSQTPTQSVLSEETGSIKLNSELIDGLYGLVAEQYIEIYFYFDKSDKLNLETELKFKHHISGEIRGVFATRSPNRPNGIGKSIVEILEIRENVIKFKAVDMLDGTPVLDIKPYVERLNP